MNTEIGRKKEGRHFQERTTGSESNDREMYTFYAKVLQPSTAQMQQWVAAFAEEAMKPTQ